MKWYPIKGTQFDKYEYVDLDNSKSSKGKQILTFPNGQKAHMKDSEVQKFFSLTDPKEEERRQFEEEAELQKQFEEEAELQKQLELEAELQKQLELEEELEGLPEED